MKKKKRSRPPKQIGGGSSGLKSGGASVDSKKVGNSGLSKGNAEEHQILLSLVEAFGSVSMEEAEAAYKEANRDVGKTAEILQSLVDSFEDKSTTCSSSSSGNVGSTLSSESSASDVSVGVGCVSNGVKQKGSAKKVVAVAGMVSTMLGKDYVRSMPKKNSSKMKGSSEENWNKEDAEQFLYSMLGEDCELSLAVVRDVLCQCGYDVEKALNVLLELSATSTEQAKTGENIRNIRNDFLFESSDNLTDKTSDSTSHSSESDLYESIWFTGLTQRTQSKYYGGPEAYSSSSGNSESELPQKILESLFNMPTPKNAEHEPKSMNWKNVVRKMASLGQKVEFYPSNEETERLTEDIFTAKGDEYQVFRESAKQHWESMRSYYQKAATAFSNGEREHAAYLSEQGRLHNQRAQEADEKASQNIFIARNKNIENVITIDLHGQHVKQAMKLLKLHLLFGAYVRSVRLFRVITGCGRHGVGKSKLKHTVIGLLDKEGIQWREENIGTLLVKLDGQTDFSFLDTDSDDE